MSGLLRALCALALLAASAAGVRAETATLTFGVLNQQSPVLTAERWNPILTYLAGKTGVPLRLAMGATVERTNAMMAEGAFDLVFTNHNFKPEYDGLGLRVIARWGLEPVHTAIVVAADAPLGRLEDLDGRRVAFPSQHAFLGYAVPSVALAAAGVSVDEVFSGNQEGALAQLKAGRVDAAAVNSRFLEQYGAREGVSYRTIHLSDPFPDLAVVAHPRLPEAIVARLRDALVGMGDDPDAAVALRKARCPGFSAADDSDYDGVRAVYRRAAP